MPDSPGDSADSAPVLGRWKVVKLTGSVFAVETRPAPPSGICAPFSDTYAPLLDSPDTWVGLSATGADVSGVELSQLLLAETGGEGFDINAFPRPSQLDPLQAGIGFGEEPDALFVFSFAFDNGYHSNGTLEGLDTYYLEIERAATATTYGGGFFGLEPEGLVRGWSSSSMSGTMKGESFFVVTGRLVAPGRMAGTWEYVEPQVR